MSICFVHAWNSGWCEIAIAAWLSVKTVDVVGKEKLSSEYKDWCHSTCLVMWVAAMYLALAVDSAMVCCFFELQATAPLAIIVT